MTRKLLGLLGLACALVAAPALALADEKKDGDKAKIVVIAGRPSHGKGEHEHNAGCKLLVKWLSEIPGVEPIFVANGWPEDEKVFEGARSVVFYMDGGGGHPMIQGERLATMKKLMDKGVGLVCLHYAVEFPKGKPGDALLDWLGGYYETGYSDNPHNDARITPREGHPIARGVKPFRANDEWYFKIRFREDDKRVTPILVAEELRGHDNKTYTEQTVAWATERADGGRSFGFTGAHMHTNWGNPDFRKLVLNATLWTAHLDVPEGGVKSEATDDDLTRNLDPK